MPTGLFTKLENTVIDSFLDLVVVKWIKVQPLATCRYLPLKVWLVQIEMCCKCERHTRSCRFSKGYIISQWFSLWVLWLSHRKVKAACSEWYYFGHTGKNKLLKFISPISFYCAYFGHWMKIVFVAQIIFLLWSTSLIFSALFVFCTVSMIGTLFHYLLDPLYRFFLFQNPFVMLTARVSVWTAESAFSFQKHPLGIFMDFHVYRLI